MVFCHWNPNQNLVQNWILRYNWILVQNWILVWNWILIQNWILIRFSFRFRFRLLSVGIQTQWRRGGMPRNNWS